MLRASGSAWSFIERRRGWVTKDAAAGHETERLRRYYDKSAADYDRWMRVYDRWLLGDGRRHVCSRAHGRTLDLAIGTGLNLAWYPLGVQLTGIDLSAAMLAIAARRAQKLGIAVDLRCGDAQALDFPDNAFDTVVSTLFLSTVPDCEKVAAEIRRVLTPGGMLLLLDHVRSPVRPVRWMERRLGHRSQRYIQRYTNPPEAIARYIEDF